jgi:cell division septation protein DedD
LKGFAFAWKPGWITRALASLQAGDDHVTDEEILTILRAGEAGMKIEDLCHAGDIPVETYYTWRAKFGGLTPAKVRALRQREKTNRRLAVAALAALVALSIGVPGLLMVSRRGASAAASSVPAAPAATTAPGAVAAPAATAPAPQAAAAVQGAEAAGATAPGSTAPAPPAAATQVKAEAFEIRDPGDLDGYSVQIAALPDLNEAREALAALAAAGYQAYLAPRKVDAVEMYRVRVGPLKTRLLAEEVAARLQREGHGTPWITR